MIKPATARSPAHHHSALQDRMVRWGKFALPVIAIALGFGIFRLAQVEQKEIRVLIGRETEIITETIDSITMENARFAGRDDRNRSFTVTAKKAQQKSADSPIIHLVQPKADLDLSGGRLVAIHAQSGIYVRNDQMLNLAGDVTVSDNRGFEFHTTSASIDLGRHTATGDAPVTGSGPSGDITSEGFRVFDDGDRVMFTGKTNLTVTVADGEAGAPADSLATP